MTITVTTLSATRVLIVTEPSIAARVVYGRRSTSELAVREAGYWRYATCGRGWVGLQLEAEIDDAMRAAKFDMPMSISAESRIQCHGARLAGGSP